MNPHLDPVHVEHGCREAGIGAPARERLLETARVIASNERLRSAAERAHHVVYDTELDMGPALEEMNTLLGERAADWKALMLLESARLVRERQGRQNVPEAISRAINERHGLGWLRRSERDGRCAVDDWLPQWFRFVGSGNLYRLGRLEFARAPWTEPFHAYRDRDGGTLMLLAKHGDPFTDAGYCASAPDWRAEFEAAADSVIGHPVLPSGRVSKRRVRLPKPRWEPALFAGDTILDLHVPVEGELSIAALGDALRRAERFFDDLYPETPFVAYVCHSWLFTDQLQVMLGETSNIVRWQREGYLYPTDMEERWFLEFTFGAARIDPATAPRDTRLRRAVVEAMSRRERLRGGGYLLMRQDLARFGAQPYISDTERAIARYSVA